MNFIRARQKFVFVHNRAKTDIPPDIFKAEYHEGIPILFTEQRFPQACCGPTLG